MSLNNINSPEEPTNTIHSVTQINMLAKSTLEEFFSAVQVEGEISELIQHRSGHWYLSLKDDRSQLRVAMFKGNNIHVKFTPENGMQVIIKGRLSLYSERGSYQLIAEDMQPAGIGKLHLAFEKLKKKLAAEGLFEKQRKQPLPEHTQQIAIITSPQGAALHDIQSTFARRYPAIRLVLIPVAVQGEDSSEAVTNAISQVNRLKKQGSQFDPDAIIVARGGGSIEDLWAFNEENVAYAIANSRIPVVSAVGHETDFTIADFVADVRAPTPTAAAELLSPDRNAKQEQLNFRYQQLYRAITQLIRNWHSQLKQLSSQLKHPGSLLEQQAQSLDNLDLRLQNAIEKNLIASNQNLNHLINQLQFYSPKTLITQHKEKLFIQTLKLKQTIQKSFTGKKQSFHSLTGKLEVVSPLATLHRGYAIAKTKQNKLIRDASKLNKGDIIETTFAKGSATCEVKTITNNQ